MAGEPQIKIGDFIYNEDYERSMLAQSLSYSMTGDVKKSKELLNRIVLDCIDNNKSQYSGFATVIYGSGTGYYEKHVKLLEGVDGISLIKFDFESHNDCIPIFQEKILELNDACWDL